MKRFGTLKHNLPFAILILVGLACSFSSVHAQNDKKKKAANKQMAKQWKSKAKQYIKNPLALKAKEEAYQNQIEELTKKNAACEKQKTEANAELERLSASIRRRETTVDSLRRMVENYKSEIERTRAAMEATRSQAKNDVTPGIIFRVQVGAFQKFDMNRYLQETGETLTGENGEALNKYMMGKFRDYQQAQNFRDDIRRLGIKDAWVVAFRDGVRIDIKQALAVQKQEGSAPPATEGGQ